jgi:hypothetical protein
MGVLFDCLAAACAFGAAWFWYKSASAFVPDPPAGAFAEQIMPALADYREAVRRAAQLNRLAALLSGASALFMGLGLLFHLVFRS